MTQTGTPETIGELNRKVILEYVRKHGPVSRADIRRGLGLSFPTVSTNVKKLVEGNYLLELGEGDNPIGRKSTLLGFNRWRGYVIGIDIGRSEIRVILADLYGEEVAYLKEVNVDFGNGEHGVTRQLSNMIHEVICSGGIEDGSLRCICVGIPGICDRKSGKLRLAPFVRSLDLKEICDHLTERYNVPVCMDNSVNYGAIGEKWCGVAQNYRNIVYINYGVGLGAALILNGELYHGMDNAAGEIGFMVPGREALRTQFDETGVLEGMISGKNIRDMLAWHAMDTDISNLPQGSSSERQMLETIEKSVLENIGMMLINITSVFNEEVIVIGGGLGQLMGERFIPVWEQMLEQHVPFVPKIVTSGLQSRANVMGAVAVAIRKVNDAEIELIKEGD